MNSIKCLIYGTGILLVILLIIIAISSCTERLTRGGVSYIELGDNDLVDFATLNQEEQAIYYYSKSDSKIKKYNINNKQTEDLVETGLDNVKNIYYAPDLSKTIIQTFDPFTGLKENWLFNLSSTKKTKLSDNIGEMTWSSDSKKIVYRYTEWSKNENVIYYSEPERNNKTKITDIDFGFEGIGIGWISNQEIYYYPLASEAAAVPIYKININNLSKINIGQNKNYMEVKFYKDKGIVSIYKQGNIGIINQNGELIKTIDKNSSIEKTDLSNNNLFVAVWTENGDNFYKINLDTNEERELIKNSEKVNYDISNIMVDSEQKKVYFISDEKLYRLNYE